MKLSIPSRGEVLPLSTATCAIVIASAGRPDLLAEAMKFGSDQQDVEIFKVVSVPGEESLPHQDLIPSDWLVVQGARGAAAQRNVGLDALPPSVRMVAFFDDDSAVRRDYVKCAKTYFDAHPTLVGLTGRVLLDGKKTGEIDRDLADRLLTESEEEELRFAWKKTRELYGANFAIRIDRLPPIRFDDRLPLYSWLEDHDLARRMLAHGRLAKAHDCVIVHRAASAGGRTNHVRFGYSQFVNPVYLHQKGSFPAWLMIEQIARPLLMNVVASLRGTSSSSWRRERLRGNFHGLRDVVRGIVRPERATDF